MIINLIFPYSPKVEQILFHNTNKLDKSFIKSNEKVSLLKVVYERNDETFEVIWNPHDYLIKSDFKCNLIIMNDETFEYYADKIDESGCENLIYLIPEPLDIVEFKGTNGVVSQIFSNQVGNDYKMILTQVLYYWNTKAPLRWFFEFKDINDNLRFDYKFGFNWGRVNTFRVNLSQALNRTIKDLVFVSSTTYDEFLNDVGGTNIWDDLNTTNPSNDSNPNFGIDYFFRILPKSEILIIDETQKFKSNTHFLTEKTFGCILANKPFIPTDILTLELLKKHGFLKKYPFEKEIKNCRKNIALFTNFIHKFNQNYDDNLYLLKEWTNEVHEYFLYNINEENSFLNHLKT